MPWRLANALTLSSLRCTARRTASVVRALPCKTCPITPPEKDDGFPYHHFLGLNTYTTPLATANGELRAARTTLRNVRVNGITAYDVQAIVLPRGASSVSLLGMSFLSKLGGFEVARGNLILKP